jgi:choline dehydrogenase
VGYDVLIVGAGPAGLVLASRLSEDPTRTVALVEAGPDYPSPGTAPDGIRLLDGLPYQLNLPGMRSTAALPYDWNLVARATDSANPPMRVPRGKVVGGSSAVNGSMFVRGTVADFAYWAAQGSDEWSFDKVLPYYRRLETDHDFNDEFHGASGPIPVMRAPRTRWGRTDDAMAAACAALGYPYAPDHNRPGASGVGPIPRNSLDNVRFSVAGAYLGPARARGNLTILSDCTVRRVVVNGKRAVGVSARRRGKEETLLADEIILCAGAFGSPHLLLLSGIGPADMVKRAGVRARHDLAGVGQNLRDHPNVAMFWERRDGVGSARPPQLFLRFSASASQAADDCRLMFWTLPGVGALANAESMQLALYKAAGAGELSLRSADPCVQPDIDFRYLAEEADRLRMRELVELATELATRPSLSRLLRSRVRPALAETRTPASADAWIRRNIRTSHHASGTAKMGPQSDPLAVVDQHGRVHGIDALRVADASIMPDCVSQNPHCTVIMIGERIAAFIREAA